jgi:hypothetical protein
MPPQYTAVSENAAICGCELHHLHHGCPIVSEVTLRHALAGGDSPANKKIHWFKIATASQVNPLPFLDMIRGTIWLELLADSTQLLLGTLSSVTELTAFARGRHAASAAVDEAPSGLQEPVALLAFDSGQCMDSRPSFAAGRRANFAS